MVKEVKTEVLYYHSCFGEISKFSMPSTSVLSHWIEMLVEKKKKKIHFQFSLPTYHHSVHSPPPINICLSSVPFSQNPAQGKTSCDS